jgi:Ricin-type beta-trefoil lectin domain
MVENSNNKKRGNVKKKIEYSYLAPCQIEKREDLMLNFLKNQIKKLTENAKTTAPIAESKGSNFQESNSNTGYYLIRSKLNGMVLDIAGNNPEPNANVVVHPVHGTYGAANQQWQITGNGLIKSRLNGFVLDIQASNTEPFTPVVVNPVNGSDGTPNQQWTNSKNGLLKSKLNGLVLDIIGSINEPFTPVVMYPVNETNGTPNQQWEFVPIPAEALAEPLQT